MPLKISNLILVVILIVLAVAAGFLGGYTYAKNTLRIGSIEIPDFNSNLFSRETAQVRGKVVSIEGTTLTVINDQNVKGKLAALDSIAVRDGAKPTASASTGIKSIELNRFALINLLKVENGYKATLITYIPTSTSSATPPKNPSPSVKR